MRRRVLIGGIAAALLLAVSGTAYIAFPTEADLPLPAPLKRFDQRSVDGLRYARDFAPLARGFRPQIYRSFCGPATISTVLRAYGVDGVDQRSVFSSIRLELKAFYSGMTLDELDALARSVGLRTERVYADALSPDEFRDRLKTNLAQDGDFVVINYDRRVLKQAGAGHISAVGAYDEGGDAFLVLDEAAYRYPFTWIPTPLLYSAIHTEDSGNRFRGLLFIHGYDTSRRFRSVAR